jgi:hypothetical protein
MNVPHGVPDLRVNVFDLVALIQHYQVKVLPRLYVLQRVHFAHAVRGHYHVVSAQVGEFHLLGIGTVVKGLFWYMLNLFLV